MSYRTHQCGEFSADAIGAEAIASGWTARKRDHGPLLAPLVLAALAAGQIPGPPTKITVGALVSHDVLRRAHQEPAHEALASGGGVHGGYLYL